jgi:U3 small nucleolar RNA-associated protein 22
MKNAIRPVVGSTDKAKPLIPTPFYNASLRADSNFTQYLKLLHLTTKQVDGFRDLCILGRIWLRQRGLGGHISSGGFGQFEWAVMTALLLQDGAPKGHHVLSPSYSTYQLFKATLQYLSTTDLVKNPVCFQAPDFSLATSDNPVFYDGPRGHNILFKMTPWSYAKLHEEAKLSIEMLNDTTFDQFDSIFITSKDNAIQEYDSLFQVPVSKPPTVKALADHRSHTSLFTFNLYAILKEGLTDRVKDIQLMVPSFSSWSLRSSAPSAPARILVGVVFDPANIDRTVDHGPPAEHKSGAAKFQKFWGDKAELRRFKDGSILESLVWSQTPDSSIFQEIITYLVKRHFDSEVGEGVEFIDHDISRLLPYLGSSPKVFSNLMAAFRTLEKDLRVLESLPLQLKLLSAVGPQLRLSSVKLPTFSPRQQLQNPVDVLVHLEGSGRWPDDIVAIQRTKMAFLLKIGALLEDSVDGLTTRFGLENTTQPLCNSAFLDVLYPSGAGFRLGIYIDREYTLLDRQLKDSTTDFHLREDLRFARSLITRKYIQLPLHAQSVQTNCTRYPLLSPTIRLVKKWFESHMLCDHVSEEFIELVVLHTFLHPYPWRSPSSPVTGFLRTLHFLSRWDWRVTPLVIDFSGSMTNKDVTAINTRLTAWRKLDPGMNRIALFAASNHDMTGTVFTDGGPSKVVAGRMTALARSACLLAKDQALSLDPRNLFKSSTSEHDFVIHISRKFTENRGLKSDAQVARFKNLELQQKQDLHLVGYEPVQLYLAELTELFTTSIVFFHDPVAARIAGLWNPQTTSRPFKINLPYGTKPTTGHVDDKDKQDVDIDKQAVLSAIARLGGDMISRIEVHH